MIWLWLGFIAFVLAMLALDLGVFHRKTHVVGVPEALGWSAVWVTLGLSSYESEVRPRAQNGRPR